MKTKTSILLFPLTVMLASCGCIDIGQEQKAELSPAEASAAIAKDFPKRLKNYESDYNFFNIGKKASRFKQKFEKLPTGSAKFKVEQPRDADGVVVKATDFGLNESREDCGEVIKKALEHCKKVGASRLEIPKGVYKFFDKSGILVEGFKDFTIEGNGSTFIFRRYSEFKDNKLYIPEGSVESSFLVRNCERIKLCNFIMDWDWATDPLASVIKVINNHVDKKGVSYFDVEFVGYKHYPLYKKPMRVKVITALNEKLDGFVREKGKLSQGYYGTGNGHYGSKNEWLSPNTARIYPAIKPENLPLLKHYEFEFSKSKNHVHSELCKPGHVMRLMHYYYGKNAFNLDSNTHITLSDIHIAGTRGMGIVVLGTQKYMLFERVKIEPLKGDFPPRPCAVTADAVHFKSSAGYAKFIDCEFTLNEDDFFNFHDVGGYAKVGSHGNLTFINAGGTKYFGVKEGDEIDLYAADYTPLNYRAKIKWIKWNIAGLEKPLPFPQGTEFYIQNPNYSTGNIILKGCKFKNCSGRGIMQAGNITIENCLFENLIRAPLRIQRAFSPKEWSEGYACKNIVVRKCTFKDSVSSAVIYGMHNQIFMGSRRYDSGYTLNKEEVVSNVLIEKNKFENNAGTSLFTFWTKDVIFRNNTITLSENLNEHNKSYDGSFLIEDSDNVYIVNNTFKTNGKPVGAFVKKANCNNVVIEGNRLK